MANDYENPAATIFRGMNDYGKEASDYQTTMAGKPAGDYRLCPLKAACQPVLACWNTDPAPDVSGLLRAGVVKVRADGEPPRVEYVGGRCDGSRCAWYDQTAERCAVLSLTQNK